MVFLAACGVPLAAQMPEVAPACYAPPTPGALPGIANEHADYVRAAALRASEPGEVLIRRPSAASRPGPLPCDDPWEIRQDTAHLTPTPAVSAYMDALYNSGYPRGIHTGLLWPGRGAHVLWTVGADYRLGPIHAGLYPQLAYQQNREFPIVPFPGDSGSIYAYPWWRSARGHHPQIDWPQRHGDEAFWSASLGQSFIAAEGLGLRAGASTENLWWGPAIRNSILLGNDAAGFPHAFLSTRNGISTPAGRLHAEMIWGSLTESEYFDDVSANDRRFLSGIVVSIQPRGLTGLSLGLARLYYQVYRPGSLGFGDFLPLFESPLKSDLVTPDNPTGNDQADQMLGAYFRYALPRSGFEVYAEWTRNDHSQNLRDFFAEPEHSRAYTLGFQQVIPHGARWYRLHAELTQLGVTRTATHRTSPTYYQHHLVRQGYTHRGQLLGARIGPGSEAQYAGFDIFTRRGRHGVLVERVRYDDDAFYRFTPRNFYGHDVELTVGTEHFLRLSAFDLRAGLLYSSRRNRNFRYCNPQGPFPTGLCQDPRFRDRNWSLPLSVAWRP